MMSKFTAGLKTRATFHQLKVNQCSVKLISKKKREGRMSFRSNSYWKTSAAIAALLPRVWWLFQCLNALKKLPLHLCVTSSLHLFTYSCKLENELKIVPEVICTDHIMEEVALEGHCEGGKKYICYGHIAQSFGIVRKGPEEKGLQIPGSVRNILSAP